MRKRLLALIMALTFAFGSVAPAAAYSLPASLTAMVGAKKDGWYTSKAGKKYYYVNGKKVTGIYKIGKKNYAFDSKGVLQGKTQIFVWNKKYYKVSKSGVAKRYTGAAHYAAKLLAKTLTGDTVMKQRLAAFAWAASLKALTVPTPTEEQKKDVASYYGLIGFKNLYGDCTVQAYTYYWLAKVLGDSVKVINGYVKNTNVTPATFKEHSWVEFTKRGKTYIMDPNFNKEYGSKVASPTKYPLGFYIRYGSAKTLMYCRPDKTEIEKNGKA